MTDVRARFESLAMNVRSGTAEEMRNLLASDLTKWSKLATKKSFKIIP
jgi:hypothetical protein